MSEKLKQDHVRIIPKKHETNDSGNEDNLPASNQYLQGRGAQFNTKNKFLKNEIWSTLGGQIKLQAIKLKNCQFTRVYSNNFLDILFPILSNSKFQIFQFLKFSNFLKFLTLYFLKNF